MSNEADAIVSAIIAKWRAGFATLDAAALSSLYARNAFFFGSNPKLYRGRAGVARLFQRPAALAQAERGVFRGDGGAGRS
ncbi:ketosteroid isomerase-like protein [Bradyrhizobium sp. GM5.1]